MPAERVWDPNTRRWSTRKTTTGEEVAGAESTERMTNTEGLGDKVKPVLAEGRGPFPKQEQGEDPETFRKRIVKWRESGNSAPKPPRMGGMTTDDAAEALAKKKER